MRAASGRDVSAAKDRDYDANARTPSSAAKDKDLQWKKGSGTAAH